MPHCFARLCPRGQAAGDQTAWAKAQGAIRASRLAPGDAPLPTLPRPVFRKANQAEWTCSTIQLIRCATASNAAMKNKGAPMRLFAALLVVIGLVSSTAMAQPRPACMYNTDQTVTSLIECATYERTRVSCAATLSPSDNDVWIVPSRKLSRAMGELTLRIARIADIPNDDVVEGCRKQAKKCLRR